MKRLVGERKALAAAVMAFYAMLYAVVALSGAAGEAGRAIAAIAGVYGLAFFGLVAGYFWARWFTVGLSLFGVIQGALGLWQLGAEPIVLFMLITHAVAALFLWGDAMRLAFDGQEAWRSRLSMDEHAVNRLGNAVTRLGISLPLVLIWALTSGGLALGAAGLALLATAGMIRMRTWGVLAMIGTAGLLVGSVASSPCMGMQTVGWTPVGSPLAVLAAGLLVAGALPFFGPIRRFLAR
jgi:hypothetical protein